MKQIIALLLVSLGLIGCSGTRNAYSAAETMDDYAKVVAEHYYAVVNEAARLKDSGQLSGRALADVQSAVRVTRPVINELATTAQAFEAVKTAETEEQLQQALDRAIIKLSQLIDLVKQSRRNNASYTEPSINLWRSSWTLS